MAEVPEELPVAGKFLDAVPPGGARQPDVSCFIHHDCVFGLRPWTIDSGSGPARHISWTTPTLEKVALRIELQDCRRRDAAIVAGRGFARARFIGCYVTRPADYPNVIVFVDNHGGDTLHHPFVRQGQPRPKTGR